MAQLDVNKPVENLDEQLQVAQARALAVSEAHDVQEGNLRYPWNISMPKSMHCCTCRWSSTFSASTRTGQVLK
jgi:hypothetical protein